MHLSKQKDERIRGDKLRNMILLIYLNTKYGTGKVRISKLKETLGYKGQGIYNILDGSNLFETNLARDDVRLTEYGTRYVEKWWLPYFSAFNPVSYLFIILGSLLLIHWLLRTFANIIIVFDLYSGLALIVGGIILRFFFLRLFFWIMKLSKKL